MEQVLVISDEDKRDKRDAKNKLEQLGIKTPW